MSPGQYTELFFLDEATGLAAGHRPCAECRRPDYRRFKQAWIDGNPGLGLTIHDSVDAIDCHLQNDRLDSHGVQRKRTEQLSALPSGTFVQIDESDVAYLLWNDMLLRWTPAGYKERLPVERQPSVTVLTPKTTVNAIRAGYTPIVHPTTVEFASD